MAQTGEKLTDSELDFFHDQTRSNWVRLQTLVVVRWVAIIGQIIAVFFAVRSVGLSLPIGLLSVTIGLSVLVNLLFLFLFPASKRLSERDATLILLFDLLQLGCLLFLTGGLNNPFSLLILAPVIIAANVLRLRSVLLIGGIAISVISALGFSFLPLTNDSGHLFALPGLFRFGFWTALVIGVVFLGVYSWLVTTEISTMGEALLATRLALAREQKLTDLGGVVAAAAHELGTPLATIKLASSELVDDLKGQDDLQQDAMLIHEQTERCRDILQSMGRAGKDDRQMRLAPIESVLREAAEPHMERGIDIRFHISEDTDQPMILRRSEIIHGLRNLIQNAVDFASGEVQIRANWREESITVWITDDGNGYPPQIIGRIGDPFVSLRKRTQDRQNRPVYSGMGLGLFIAKTLLERTSAELDFSNGDPALGQGAIVRVKWSRSAIEPNPGEQRGALGENQPISA